MSIIEHQTLRGFFEAVDALQARQAMDHYRQGRLYNWETLSVLHLQDQGWALYGEQTHKVYARGRSWFTNGVFYLEELPVTDSMYVGDGRIIGR